MNEHLKTYDTWIEKDLVDTTGKKIGSIDNLYVDTETKRPTWLEVQTGFFGTKHTFVPIDSVEAHATEDHLITDYDADFVKDAPHFDEDQVLSDKDEIELYTYYQRDYVPAAAGDMTHDHTATAEHVSTDNELVRAEEELNVDTQTVNRGKVRLHKYVTTEEIDLTVPVQREHVRVVRTPVDGNNVVVDELSETVAEVTVSEEVPVVTKDVVAKETVALEKDVQTHDAHVTETVAKENIEVVDENKNL